MNDKMICNICGQVVSVRKRTSIGSFPVQHRRPDGHPDNCHGFYIVSNAYPKEENND
jgi:hypothetical protein